MGHSDFEESPMYNDLLLERLAALNPNGEDDDARIDRLINEIEALDNLLSPEARSLIRDLRSHTVSDDVYDELEEKATFGERMADKIATFAGSWFFIGGFILFMAAWMALNVYLGSRAFDTYPFILLNLGLSTLAALQAPVILMSQNRQSSKDRAVADNDFQVNLKNEAEIADLHRKLDHLTDTIEFQSKAINALVNARRQEVTATVHAIEATRHNAHALLK
jgi:uncharacterized membrane protein